MFLCIRAERKINCGSAHSTAWTFTLFTLHYSFVRYFEQQIRKVLEGTAAFAWWVVNNGWFDRAMWRYSAFYLYQPTAVPLSVTSLQVMSKVLIGKSQLWAGINLLETLWVGTSINFIAPKIQLFCLIATDIPCTAPLLPPGLNYKASYKPVICFSFFFCQDKMIHYISGGFL